MSEDRRLFSRVGFHSSVTVEVQGQAYQAELIDISLKGALIISEGDFSFVKNEPCVFELRLDADTVAVKTAALIVYSQTNQLGLEFQNLDLESMVHLRRLIELNLGDPDKIQQELFFLMNPTQGS
jgi:c-di-GMP-binding flagellar brake protein YcgR